MHNNVKIKKSRERKKKLRRKKKRELNLEKFKKE
jgi:hypothetical protein